MIVQFSLVLGLDNIILNNYWRKYYTYLEIGWDEASINKYLLKKEFTMQIATFNTVRTSFSASSRRNRFYEIYNRLNMLEQDVVWGDSVEALKKISKSYQIFIISSRSEDLRPKTLEIMKRLGFPMENLTFFFKSPTESLSIYRKKTLKIIKEKFISGVGICLNPTDRFLFERINYTPIGFSSIKDYNEFNGQLSIICQNWADILHSLNCAN